MCFEKNQFFPFPWVFLNFPDFFPTLEIPTFPLQFFFKFWSLSSIPEKTFKSHNFPNGQNYFFDNK
jgi:hypothetical protein